MLFDNVNWNPTTGFQISEFESMIQPSNSKFLSPEEGFLRGNLIKEEYDAYKNMTFLKLKPENEREQLLFKVMAYCFAINDLNLYLDVHPEDEEALNLFKKYAKESMKLESEYSDKYGPLTLKEIQGTQFKWIENPWPWDKVGGTNYV
ncbi:MAG: spore coat protein CotJB [Bacilli bacterium]|nr:spore coat protein CotJB [Bacilli bacterium]MBR1817956.1 spore coat protein CotJB [Bacilli bacterium]